VEWLNYHHLLYFWTVTREGGITKASKKLQLSPPTVSLQIRALEESLGEKLFERRHRSLVLTDFGSLVYRYADEIFTLGQELTDAVKDRPTHRPVRFFVGVAMVVPKLVAYTVLEPALRLPEPVEIICIEDKPERLLPKLASYSLDMVLADAPIGDMNIKAYNHLLGECGLTFFSHKDDAPRYRRSFPRSLDRAPMLLPTLGSAVRRALDTWFDQIDVRPQPVGQFDDSALLKVFGAEGCGVFAAPSVIESSVKQQYGVSVIGRTEEAKERFYAISVERKIKNVAAAAVTNAARTELFS